jgi:hypothetical protein
VQGIVKLKFSIVLVILLLLASNFALGKHVTVNVGVDGRDFTASSLDVDLEKVELGRSAFADNSKVQWLSKSGEPDIPWKVMHVLLPPNAKLSTVEAQLQAEYETSTESRSILPVPPKATWIDGQQLIVWPEGKNIVDGRDVDIYQQDAFWPAVDKQIVTTGIKRQWKVARIAIPMLRYNPVTGQVQTLLNAESNIDFAKLPKGQVKIKKKDRVGRPFIKKLAVNFDTAIASYDGQAVEDASESLNKAEIASASLSSTGYTIITTNAIQNASTKLADFISHKQSLGFAVKVVTEAVSASSTHYLSGATAAERSSNVYDWLMSNYLTDDTLYVLIIGDPRFEPSDFGTSVPMMSLNTGSGAETPTDWQYSDFQVDFNWEVIVGRIPYYGSISETDHILQKTINYENDTDADWRRNVLLSMVPLDGSTPAYQYGENVKYYLLEPEAIPCTRIYDENYGLVPPAEHLRGNRYPAAEWASGQYGMVLWDSHGWAGGASGIMDSADAANLDDNYPGTTFQNSCDNSWPEHTTNIAYEILKNGGIGSIGATRNSWYYVGITNYTGVMGYKYASQIVDKQTTGYGLVYARDAVGWYANAAVFTLYGDPSVRVMPDAPASTVTPTHGCYFGGPQRGPFFSQTGTGNLTLFNNSTSMISWNASESADWLDISPASGAIGAAGTVEVVLTINSVADSLPPGIYTDTVVITDATNDIIALRDVTFEIAVRGLVGYWNMDETIGTTVTDSSRQTHNGILEGTTFDESSITGKYAGGLSFDGVDDRISTTIDLSETNYAVSLWFRTTVGGGLYQADGGGSDRYISVAGGNVWAHLWHETGGEWINSTGLNLSDGQWHHVVHVYRSGVTVQRLYVDGVLRASGTKSHSDFDWQTLIYIGWNGNNGYFNGDIDDVRIYNHSINSQEVLNLANDNVGVHSPSPFNKAVDVTRNNLSWGQSPVGVGYHVYLGTNETNVQNADTGDSQYQGEQTAVTFDVSLDDHTTYYWRIDTETSSGTITGKVWSFVTDVIWEVPLTEEMLIQPDPVPGGLERNDYTGNLGTLFRVNTEVPIGRLAFYDHGGNGLASSHTVRLYESNNNGASGTVIAEVTVPAGTAAELSDGFRWVDLAMPVMLSPQTGNSWYMLAATVGYYDGDTWYDTGATGFTYNSYMDAGAGWGTYWQYNSNPDLYPATWSQSNATWYVANMAYDTPDNWSPYWVSDSFNRPSSIEGRDYTGTVTDKADDPDEGDVLTYSLVSEPAWLTIATDGQLSGLPLHGNIGSNRFTVRVTDDSGLYNDAEMTIYVLNRFTGELGLIDLANFAAQWLEAGCGSCGGADLNGDGDVDMEDMATFSGFWLK